MIDHRLFFTHDITPENTDKPVKDKAYLYRAIALSKESVKHGNYPFGALLVDTNGNILLESENTVNTSGNLIEHAEMNVISAAVKKFDKSTLASCTLYTSCQPHVMSLGAMHWAKIGKLVYALSQENLNKYTDTSGPSNPQEVFALYEKSSIKVEGPDLQNEASEPHKEFWDIKKTNIIENEKYTTEYITEKTELTDKEELFLKDSIKMSEESVKHGNHPFGALLVDAEGNIQLKIENTANTSHDVTEHAELNTVKAAVKKFDKKTLAASTLFSSCEPCAMCVGGIHLSSIGKVIYGLSHDNLDKYSSKDWSPNQPPGIYSARKIDEMFHNDHVTVKGPLLESLASVPHIGFWNQERHHIVVNNEKTNKEIVAEQRSTNSI